MKTLTILFACLLIKDLYARVVLQKKSDPFWGNFLKSPVDSPHVASGSSGNVVGIDHSKQSAGTNDQDLTRLLNEIYERIIPKQEDEIISDSATHKSPFLNLPTDKVAEHENSIKEIGLNKAKKTSVNFNELELVLDNLIKEMSKDVAAKNNVEESSSSNKKFQDFTEVENAISSNNPANSEDPTNIVDENPFISFEEFKNRFYKMFLKSDADRQRIIYSGRKDIRKDKKKENSSKASTEESTEKDSAKKRLNEIYNELKAETKRAKESMNKQATESMTKDQANTIDELKRAVDMQIKRETMLESDKKESKKRELVSLLNELTGAGNLIYKDGKVALAEDKQSTVVSNDDNDFESLMTNTDISQTNEVEDNNEEKNVVQKSNSINNENEELSKKERLRALLLDFVKVLDPVVNVETEPDVRSKETVSKASISSGPIIDKDTIKDSVPPAQALVNPPRPAVNKDSIPPMAPILNPPRPGPIKDISKKVIPPKAPILNPPRPSLIKDIVVNLEHQSETSTTNNNQQLRSILSNFMKNLKPGEKKELEKENYHSAKHTKEEVKKGMVDKNEKLRALLMEFNKLLFPANAQIPNTVKRQQKSETPGGLTREIDELNELVSNNKENTKTTSTNSEQELLEALQGFEVNLKRERP